MLLEKKSLKFQFLTAFISRMLLEIEISIYLSISLPFKALMEVFA